MSPRMNHRRRCSTYKSYLLECLEQRCLLSGDPPTVTLFSKSVNENQTLAFASTDFTANYTDPESDPMQSVLILTLPAQGSLQLNSAPVTASQTLLPTDLDNLVYVPAANYTG